MDNQRPEDIALTVPDIVSVAPVIANNPNTKVYNIPSTIYHPPDCKVDTVIGNVT